MASPNSMGARLSVGSNAKTGRPPKWTPQRSRKLLRLYLYTTMKLEQIIKVLEEPQFKPEKNSAQKTISRVLDKDARYLRPQNTAEMNERFCSLSKSPSRSRNKKDRDAEGSAIKEEGGEAAAAIEVEDVEHAPQPDIPACPPSNTMPRSRSGPYAHHCTPQCCAVGCRQPWNQPSSIYAARGIEPFAQLSLHDEDPSKFVPKPFTRASTFLSTSTSSSFQQLGKRMSGYSVRYAKKVHNLIKQLTISGRSDMITTPQFPDTDGFGTLPDQTPNPSHAVAGDLLSAHLHSNNCSKGTEHDAELCWCAIAASVAQDTTWVLPDGEPSELARDLEQDPSLVDPSTRDQFGNTAFHLLAASEEDQDELLNLLRLAPGQMFATNSAGQTFLHLLAQGWFIIDSEDYPLLKLLTILSNDPRSQNMVHLRDVYGRTFFHRIQTFLHPDLGARLVTSFGFFAAPMRDAFGNVSMDARHPLPPPSSLPSGTPPRRAGTMAALDSLPETSPTRLSPLTTNEQEVMMKRHTEFLSIIRQSYVNPNVEDTAGRNGLHCIAEAIIDNNTMEDQQEAMSVNRAPKRKLNEHPPPRDETNIILMSRLRHLKTLLNDHTGTTMDTDEVVPPSHRSIPKPDVNHYDMLGNTVLMHFIATTPDDQEDKRRTLAEIYDVLLRAGARLDARNRQGETALLVAARLGRKIPLKMLLERGGLGAGVHARDAKGRGVLDLIDELCGCAEDDLALYGKLEACRVLLTGNPDRGVMQKPTVLDEWAYFHPRQPQQQQQQQQQQQTTTAPGQQSFTELLFTNDIKIE